MNRIFGFERLAAQACEILAAEITCSQNDGPGDTEIEKLLFRALDTISMLGHTEFNEVLIARDKDAERRLMSCEYDTPWSVRMIVRPQAEINGRRVDFLISVPDFSSHDWGAWRSLIVECNGHNFHEKTKEQVAKDRAKDRAAVLNGIDQFRFSGSEIWRDPWGCAEQIFNWAIKDFGQ